MEVCVYAEKYFNNIWYEGCTLQLPSHQKALEDAMQRERVGAEDNYILGGLKDWPDFMSVPLGQCHATLEELNLLALKISQMNKEQQNTLEGVLELVQEKTIKNLINAAYNPDCVEFLPGIMDEEELGEVSIENDLVPILENLPEVVYSLLSPEKVGTYVKEQEQGVFTTHGYCFKCSEQWIEPYDGTELPEQVGGKDSILSLHLWSQRTNRGVWIELPCSHEEKLQACRDLGGTTFRECSITEIRSPVTQFEYTLNKDVEIEKMDRLAEKLALLSQKELVKYKAIVAYEYCGDVDHAIELYHTMDQYTFDPLQVTFADYGRECLREQGADLEAEAFQNFDFESYGHTEYVRSRLSMTPYGAISCESPMEERPEYDQQMGI